MRRTVLAALVCAAALPLGSAQSADCSSNRYSIDGVLSLASLSNPTCLDSLSGLSSTSTLFRAHQSVLIVLWSLLLFSAIALSLRVFVTRSDLFSFSKSSYYMPVLLALLLATPASNILYNALGPLSTTGLLPAEWSVCWLFLSDLFLVAAFSFLYPYTRDLLLLSPVISDRQYNAFVQDDRSRVVSLVALVGLLGLLVAAALSAQAAVLLVYVCVVLAYVALFDANWMWRLYGLAARDVKAVRRISVATVPSKLAGNPAPARNSWTTTEAGSAMMHGSHAPSISIAASTAPHSSLTSGSTTPRPPHAAAQPNESPKSANSLAPPALPAALSALPAGPSSHSISISPLAPPSVSAASGSQRRVSMVVAVEAGRKPVKTFAAERVNVRRVMLLHTALAVAFVAIYAAHVALLASSAALPAADVIGLHFARGLVACVWCLLFVWTLWPSRRQLQKARHREAGRRASIKRASMLLVSAADTAAARKSTVVSPAGVAQPRQSVLEAKAQGGAAGALQLAVDAQASEPLEDEEDDVESSRERALVLMSAAAHYMQQQHPSSRVESPVHGSSASPTASPFAHSAFATNFPPMPALALTANDPTSLLEPAALPSSVPVSRASSSAAVFAASASARVRHSLPAIHVEPLILRTLMQALTEPTTPQSAHAPAGVLSPPGMLREMPSPTAAAPSAPVNVGASSRAMGAARPTSASQTSARSSGSLIAAAGAAVIDGGHERQRSRAESIRDAESMRRDVISPRTTSSRGSRQRIFTPTSANHTNAVDT